MRWFEPRADTVHLHIPDQQRFRSTALVIHQRYHRPTGPKELDKPIGGRLTVEFGREPDALSGIYVTTHVLTYVECYLNIVVFDVSSLRLLTSIGRPEQGLPRVFGRRTSWNYCSK